jgi:haloalkane dehalogenase
MHEAFDRVPVVDLDGLQDLFRGKLEVVQGANPFMYWIKFCASCPTFRPENFVEMMSVAGLSPEVKAGYAAPFPDESYLAGPRRFPGLVPIMPDDPAIPDNRKAWKVLESFEKPVLTSWSDEPGVGPPDPFQQRIPGAQNREHPTIVGARHFVQEDKGEEFAANVLRFIDATPARG